MKRKRMEPKERKVQILDTALKLAAKKGGWASLTRKSIAEELNCAVGLPSRYFGNMIQLRRAVMRQAIKERNLFVIVQGLIAGDPTAKKAPSELKLEAIKSFSGV